MAEHENGSNGVRDGAIMRERGRAAKVDSGALLTRMVEESLTEVTGPEPVDVAVATDAPSLDEAQLFIEGAFDVCCLAESVLLAFKGHILHEDSFALERSDHLLCLIRWNNLVLQPLKEYHRRGHSLCGMNWRTLPV
jgi:hypothetical protein